MEMRSPSEIELVARLHTTTFTNRATCATPPHLSGCHHSLSPHRSLPRCARQREGRTCVRLCRRTSSYEASEREASVLSLQWLSVKRQCQGEKRTLRQGNAVQLNVATVTWQVVAAEHQHSEADRQRRGRCRIMTETKPPFFVVFNITTP